MEKYLIIIIIIIVIYQLCCNCIQTDLKETFTNSQSVTGIDDNNAINTLAAFAKELQKPAGVTIPGNLNLNKHVLVSDNDGWLKLSSTNNLTENANMAVKDFNVDGNFNLLLKGMIFAWNGTVAPPGWALCDGTNETPDLRSRFILGQGQGRVLGDISGRENIQLSIEEIPNHSHKYNQANNYGNWEQITWVPTGPKAQGPKRKVVTNHSGSRGDKKKFINGGSQAVFRSNSWVDAEAKGENKPFDKMQPFYVLAYIMKL